MDRPDPRRLELHHQTQRRATAFVAVQHPAGRRTAGPARREADALRVDAQPFGGVRGGEGATDVLEHQGASITGTFDAGADNVVSVSGSLNGDYTQATGIWTSTAGASGTFAWQRKFNPNQFVGSLDGGPDAWCGARAGASLPSPCAAP